MMRLPGLEVFLPLLALEGIVFWACYHYNREEKPTISRTEASLYKHRLEDEEEIFETKEDYLSQLPDDILSSILGNLSVRDAARTTILSTRWKYLFASVHPTGGPRTTLKFNCLNLFGLHRHYDHPYHQEKNKFKRLLNRSLELYSGDRVAHIEMKCCFAKEFISGFSHWLQSISRLGVERLHLSFDCRPLSPCFGHSKYITFSLDILSQASSLKHLFLSFCIVLSSTKVHFNSLLTLCLNGVVLESGHLEGIMSSCSNLKELCIENSKLPSKLRLDGTVTTIVIMFCYGVEKIDLHAAYLHTLKCKMTNIVRFRFSFVPVLEHVIVWLWKAPSNNSYIFGDCTRHLPEQVKSLTLEFKPTGVIYFPTMFRNLRELSLMLMTTCDILEIVDLSTLWSACPLLEDLNFTVSRPRIIQDERRRMLPLSPRRHTKLKQVTYNGFYGTELEVTLALYILTNAIVLERMFLSPRYKEYFGFHSDLNVSLDKGKKNSILQKLHGQAISKKAVVIIQ